MRLNEARRDLYRRLAREQGYKSRAAFKLIEANERYQFIDEGGKVADFGSAPGGWLQVASALVGPQGLVVGVDLLPVRLKEKNIIFLKSDVEAPDLPAKVAKALGGSADVLLSDLSPEVSGVWELDQTRQVELTLRILELSSTLLKSDGSAFFKLFEGERAQEVRDEFKRRFDVVRVIKPAASRNASSELYYYCKGIRRHAAGPASSS
jgi:23S rRNA (uridine2552-2'-O)-methyltransferase